MGVFLSGVILNSDNYRKPMSQFDCKTLTFYVLSNVEMNKPAQHKA